ncbi:hypothetical protein RM553_01975 [Zunongwangia sp. F363]|uniref:Lipoprotein n=1 Tax=Autumnicola tepida TaxID=3075595 RepID=A0ABU3C5H8_9FLAO|nr:hypothetical protein [Zunongwangia sp. F363]MDT0641589.1 hypothetical protein [Zunongwangia sp. F363]
MKKNYFLLLVVIAFYACSKEEYNSVEDEKLVPEYSVENVMFKNKKMPSSLKNIFSKIEEGRNEIFNDSILYLEEYDVEVVLTSSFNVSKGSYDSYTFPTIQRLDEPIKNLLFSKNKNGDYDAYLVEYGYSKNDLTELDFEEIPKKFKITPLQLDLTALTKQPISYFFCTYEYFWTPDQGQLVGVGNTELGRWVLIARQCFTITYENNGTVGFTIDYEEGTANYSTGSIGVATIPMDPVITPFDDEEMARMEYVAGILGLNNVQKSWFKTHVQSLAVVNFLEENAFSAEAVAFGKKATLALIHGDYVDFSYQVILSESFKNNSCLNGVYQDMGNASAFNTYLNNFDGDMSVANLTFDSSPTLPVNINAETSAPENYMITITFNENNLTRPRLSVARTLIHEIIHAEMFRKLLSVWQHPSLDGITYTDIVAMKEDYPGLVDYYTRWKNNVPQGMDATSAQHQAMAQHYRNVIINSLKEFDDSYSDDVYEALSWVGLKNSIAWNNLSQAQKNSINSTLYNFENNNQNCQ